MQLIDTYIHIWRRNLPTKDRAQFYFILTVIAGIIMYYQFRNSGYGVDELIPIVAGIMGIGTILTFFPLAGNFFLRVWLTISGTIAQFVFFIILLISYFLILFPIYGLKKKLKSKKVDSTTGWITEWKENKDYTNPG